MYIEVDGNQMESVAGITGAYPYVLHRVALQKTHVPWHWHEELEFVLVERGAMELSTVDRTLCFGEGEGFFVNSNVLCTMRENPPGAQTRIESHLFHPIFLSGHHKSVFESKYIQPVLRKKELDVLELRGETETQRTMLHKLRAAARLQEEADSEMQTRSLFSEIWLLLIREIERMGESRRTTQGQTQARMQSMLSFIHHNYARKLTLEDIAESAAISKRECSRCFKDCIHVSPIGYLLEYRTSQAARMLWETEDSIAEIAVSCGFTDSAYFCKVFKEKQGISPRAYRRGRGFHTIQRLQ